jgi:hypothetical protein
LLCINKSLDLFFIALLTKEETLLLKLLVKMFFLTLSNVFI